MEENNNEAMTFDEILSDKVYQSEFDKRVSKALETAKAKWETDAKGMESEIYSTLGIKSKEEIPSLLERLQAADTAKKASETAEEKAARLAAEKEETDARAKAAESQLSELRQVIFLQSKNVPADEIDFYQYKIGKLAAEKELTFEAAAAEYMAQKPVSPKPPPFAVGTGKTVAAGEVDILKANFANAAKNKNTAEMSRLQRVAASKGISLT